VKPLRVSRGVSKFSPLLLGLGLYSYRVRELLVCWLFFSALFVSLGVVMAGGVLACYAGKYVFHWASSAAPVTPVVVIVPVEFQVKAISGSSK
jgi:hypothetical protein